MKDPVAEECAEQESAEQESALDALKAAYDQRTKDTIEVLHNNIVNAINESKLPIAHIITTLALVQRETLDMAMERFAGKKYLIVEPATPET